MAWMLALGLILASGIQIADANSELDAQTVRQRLDHAREISYRQHWQQAQTLLDELAPHVDSFEPREFVDFHLLEARHLSLADRSREALERAAMLLERPLAGEQRLKVLQFSANMAVLLREYEVAFEHLLDALTIESGIKDPAAGIATYNMAAYMFGKVGEHERAIEYGEEAIRRAIELEQPNQECITRQRISPVFKWADQPEQSEAQYRRGIEVCNEIGNDLFVGVLQHGLADLLRRQGRGAEAAELAESAISMLEDSVYPLGEYEARLVLAETLYDLGAITAERRAGFEDMAEYFRANKLWDQAARMERLRARVAEDRNEPERALEYYRRHLDAREQFLDHDRSMRLAYLEIEFDTRLKEQQIGLLQEDARVAQIEATAANQQRRQRTAILVLSMLVAVLLAILMINAFRGRRYFRHLSRHDHLSGLANQGWFFERAEFLLKQAGDQGQPIFLVMADIDHFKQINDGFGHLVGDQVLGQVARRLRDAFASNSLVGRVGGEEFAVLVTARSVESVLERLERLRRGGPASSRADDPQVTLSFGISRHQHGEDLVALRKRADEALYQAKRQGRDCYVVSPEARQSEGDASTEPGSQMA
ncbi:MAG: GGDEF domain-containing protein [Wenzhouxiangellaceae bacterium]|nr:GGDEF domain-containing protein [Wenzhouxiangellaceae bacterium]